MAEYRKRLCSTRQCGKCRMEYEHVFVSELLCNFEMIPYGTVACRLYETAPTLPGAMTCGLICRKLRWKCGEFLTRSRLKPSTMCPHSKKRLNTKWRCKYCIKNHSDMQQLPKTKGYSCFHIQYSVCSLVSNPTNFLRAWCHYYGPLYYLCLQKIYTWACAVLIWAGQNTSRRFFAVAAIL